MPDYEVVVAGSKPIMVTAANQAQARNFAVRSQVTVKPLSTARAIELALAGEKLHDASDESVTPELQPAEPPAEAEEKD